MKISYHICLHIKNSTAQISHHHTFHFLRYARLCEIFHLQTYRNYKMRLKLAYFLRKTQTLPREFVGLRMQNFQGIVFCIIRNIGRFSNVHQYTFKKLQMLQNIPFFTKLLSFTGVSLGYFLFDFVPLIIFCSSYYLKHLNLEFWYRYVLKTRNKQFY